jgi:hypothetical protein
VRLFVSYWGSIICMWEEPTSSILSVESIPILEHNFYCSKQLDVPATLRFQTHLLQETAILGRYRYFGGGITLTGWRKPVRFYMHERKSGSNLCSGYLILHVYSISKQTFSHHITFCKLRRSAYLDGSLKKVGILIE